MSLTESAVVIISMFDNSCSKVVSTVTVVDVFLHESITMIEVRLFKSN